MATAIYVLPALLGAEAETWSAMGTWVTAAVAIAAGIIALRQLREVRQTRRDQTQPYVIVYMDGSEAGSEFVELVIRNTGVTAAYDVRVRFEPALMRDPRHLQHGEEARVRVPASFPVLVPGQEWRTFWDTTMARHGSELPTRYEAAVTFEERSGKRVASHAFQYVLDWQVEADRGQLVIYGLHHQAKAMRELAKDVHQWGKRHGPAGPTVWVRDGDERHRRLQRDLRARRQPESRWRSLLNRARKARRAWR